MNDAGVDNSYGEDLMGSTLGSTAGGCVRKLFSYFPWYDYNSRLRLFVKGG
jgi:hypothetical protein